jgi:serine/threonine protein kinase
MGVLVLLSADQSAKIADFGISALLSDYDATTKRCGSPGYAAPEIVRGHVYGIKVDSFSVSGLLYFIVSGKVMFSGNLDAVLKKTMHQAPNFRRSPRLARLSDECKEFINWLGEKHPYNRPTASEALQQTWWPINSRTSQRSAFSSDSAWSEEEEEETAMGAPESDLCVKGESSVNGTTRNAAAAKPPRPAGQMPKLSKLSPVAVLRAARFFHEK